MKVQLNHFGVVWTVLLVAVLQLESFCPVRALAQQPSNPCGSLSAGFKVASSFLVNGYLKNLAAGDFNRDGKMDVAVIADRSFSSSSQSVTLFSVVIYQGDGTGNLENTAEVLFEGVSLDALAVADFNRDGKLDLFVTGFPLGVAVLLGQGDGTFGQPIAQAFQVSTTRYVIDDFSGDGILDVIFSSGYERELNVLRGLGNGGFTVQPKLTGTNQITGFTSGDFDGDRKPDLALLGFGTSNFTVLLNNGAGGFKAPQSVNVSGSANSLAAGDFNADGKLDLALASTQELLLLTGNGNGTFVEAKSFRGSNYGGRVIVADFNRDNRVDVLTFSDTSVTLFYNDTTAGLVEFGGFHAGPNIRELVAVELNGDTHLDLVAANFNSQEFDNYGTILLGKARGLESATLTPNIFLRAQFLKTADLNKDNKPDFYLTQDFGSSVTYMLNDGQGRFSRPPLLQNIPNYLASIVAADFNQDGNQDFALPLAIPTSSTPPGGVIVVRGRGDGTFITVPSPPVYPLTGVPTAVVSADFNGDQQADLATTIPTRNEINVLLGTGNAAFGAPRVFSVGLNPEWLATGDFNNDGRTDLVVANRNAATLSLLLNDGNGGFTASLIGIGGNPRQVEVSDFNNDGKPDLIVGHNNAALLSVLLATTPGAFAAPRTLTLKTVPYQIATGDFNKDGKPDVAVSRTSPGTEYVRTTVISWHAGDGAGGFSNGTELPIVGAGPLAVGDFNADGLTDLASVPAQANGVWIMYGQCRTPSPVTLVNVSAASYRRAQLAPETIATAFGSNLSGGTQVANVLPLPTTLSGTQVRVRDALGVERLAPLFFVSAGQVNYLIPAGTAYGNATISVVNNGTVRGSSTSLIGALAPGLFAANANGQGPAAGVVLRVKPNGAQVFDPLVEFDPATNQFVPVDIDLGSNPVASLDKVYLALFGTGFRMRTRLENVKVYVGGQPVEALYASAQGSFAGLDQLNIQLSQNVNQRGLLTIQLVVDGKTCNTVMLKIR